MESFVEEKAILICKVSRLNPLVSFQEQILKKHHHPACLVFKRTAWGAYDLVVVLNKIVVGRPRKERVALSR
jgi:hypothetical protein